jgi:hypothetical protein
LLIYSVGIAQQYAKTNLLLIYSFGIAQQYAIYSEGEKKPPNHQKIYWKKWLTEPKSFGRGPIGRTKKSSHG